MKKSNIKLFVLLLLTSLTLSACQIPFTDIIFTTPFLEKDPETVMSLMMQKMSTIQSLSFDLSDDGYVSNKVSGIAGKKLVEEKHRRNVLGVKIALNNIMTNDLNEDIDTVKEENSALTSDFQLLPDSSFDSISANTHVTGSFDSLEQDTKFSMTMDTNIKVSNDNYNLNLSAISIGKDYYLKINSLPGVIDMFLEMFGMTDIKGRWWTFNSQDIASNEFSKDLYEEADEQSQELINKKDQIKTIITKYSTIINLQKRLPDEMIDSHKCYTYLISVNTDELQKMLNEIMLLDAKNIDTAEAEKDLKVAMDEISKLQLRLSIDKKEFYLRQTIITRIADTEITKNLPKNFTIKLNNFNISQNITRPVDAESFSDYIGKKFNTMNDDWSATDNFENSGSIKTARETAINKKIDSDIHQIQTALELYNNDAGTYPPNTLYSGDDISYEEITYLNIPYQSTIDNDNMALYNYIYVPSKIGYDIYYIKNNDGVIQKYATDLFDSEKIIISDKKFSRDVDSDQDGLNDYEEYYLYHTDFQNPDSDEDGYSDGDEIRTGYSPNGPLKLPIRKNDIAYNDMNDMSEITINDEDEDEDGLSDADELLYDTDPQNPDTDGDGFSDGDEVTSGYNPNGPGRLGE